MATQHILKTKLVSTKDDLITYWLLDNDGYQIGIVHLSSKPYGLKENYARKITLN